jgi:hypothetical protein
VHVYIEEERTKDCMPIDKLFALYIYVWNCFVMSFHAEDRLCIIIRGDVDKQMMNIY